MRRVIFLLAICLGGVAVLAALGIWQLQRLSEKEAVLADIGARMNTELAELPADPAEEAHEYFLISLSGTIGEGELHVLTSDPSQGPGFRIIAPLGLDDGRRILLDRGYVPEALKTSQRPVGRVEVTGNLLWPDDYNDFTPDPDPERNVWYSREVVPMARALETEPVLIVARSPTGEGIEPVPVSLDIPNNHLEYALTWFGLAAVWAGMTLYFLRRGRPDRGPKALDTGGSGG